MSARTAAEEQEIADKLDDVLREKLAAKERRGPGEEEQAKRELSPWAQQAVDVASGQKKEKSPKKQKKAKRDGDKSQSRRIVKSLDEVLKSANDDVERPNYLARRDVYKEVGITQAEVEAYWQRRDESSQSFADKFLFLAYPLALLAFIAICFSVYDSTVNPQTEYTSSMVGME